MIKVDEIKGLLQQAVDTLYKSKRWNESIMCIAQKMSLHGEKRRLRYESGKDHQLINYLRCDAFDLFGIELSNTAIPVSVPSISSMKGLFQAELDKALEEYEVYHDLGNKLVIAGARTYAEHLYKMCDCLSCDIKEFRRFIMQGDRTEWDASFILYYETTNHNIHDSFESKEKDGIKYPD